MTPDDADNATDPVEGDHDLLAESTFPPSVIPTEEGEPPLDSDASRDKAGGDLDDDDSARPASL